MAPMLDPPVPTARPAGPSVDLPTPYSGPAREPSRTMALSPDNVPTFGSAAGAPDPPSRMADVVYQPNLQHVLPGQEPLPPAPQLPPTQVQMAPPPEQPDIAAQLAEMRQEYGRLQASIGDIRKSYETKIDEILLQQRIAQAQQQGQSQPMFRLPDNVDPNAPMTFEQFNNALNRLVPTLQAGSTAQSIRAVWDVSPAEEAEVLSRFPGLQNTPEPARTDLIREAALRQRQYMAQPQAPTAQVPPPAQSPSPQAPVRPLGYVAEHQPPAAPPAMAEPPQPASLFDQYVTEYNKAKALPNRRERDKWTRYWWEKINQLSGNSNNQQWQTPFRVES